MKNACLLKCLPFVSFLLVFSSGNLFSMDEIITGKGSSLWNDALVRAFSRQGNILLEFNAYAYHHFGVHVTSGDLDGDSVNEIIAAPGPSPSYGPMISGFRVDGTRMCIFLAYGCKHWGANVVCGDVDGDGKDEIITAPGPGPALAGHIRGWEYENGMIIPMNINFISLRSYGANVSSGDVDTDGFDEIMTAPGAGPGLGPHIRGLNYDGVSITTIPWINFFAFGTRSYGANVSSGDIDGDQTDEILAGPGPHPHYGADVKCFDPAGAEIQFLCGFRAYNTGKSGVKLGSGNVDLDAHDEIITGPGPGKIYGSHVRGFKYDGHAVRPMPDPSFFAYQGSKYGVNVAAGNLCYQFIDLGTLGGEESSARGINDSGEVVGEATLPNWAGHAFLWEDGIGMRDLGTLPGGASSTAEDINETGQVTGWSGFSGIGTHAFLWDEGMMTDLGTLGGTRSIPFDINETGQVGGWSDTSSDQMHAFLWTEFDDMIDLGTLGGDECISLYAVNAGQVIGVSTTITGEWHLFLWERGSGMSDFGILGTLGGDDTAATDINGLLQVAGGSYTSAGDFHAFFFDDGVMTDLGTLGGDWSFAYSLNNQGSVVGAAEIQGGTLHAFLWENDVMKDLNDYLPSGFQWELAYAFDINNKGQIVGTATHQDTGYDHAFLLIP
jgi:probable HAF family extracellular repeat protein